MFDRPAASRTIRGVGDSALLVEWPSDSDRVANRKARAVAAHLAAAGVAGFTDAVVGARTLLIQFHPLLCDRESLVARIPFWEIDAALLGRPVRHEIPVCYGGSSGIDLEEIAAVCGMSPSRFVDLHAGAKYNVAFIGFAPGFPYLTGLPEELFAARLASPRLKVPGGSVAVADRYAGIYPADLPGGWRLIGRTPVTLFDPHRTPPCLLAAGDEVKFIPFEERDFAGMAAKERARLR